MGEFSFDTPEALEAVFEIDRLFSDESVEQTFGRRAWMATRGRAEFLLYLTEIQVPTDLIPYIMGGYDEMLVDHYDMLLAGLGASRETPKLSHPQEGAVDELVDEIVERINPALGEYENDLPSDAFAGLAQISDEELLHRLYQIKNSIDPKS